MFQATQLIGFGASSAGVSFVGSAITAKAGSTSASSTLAINSGLTGGSRSAAQAGDFVLAAFCAGSTTDRTLSISDGSTNYTLIASELYANDSFDINLRVAYKFISSDTDVTFGPTGGGNDGGVCAVFVFSGIDTLSPLDVAATTVTAIDGDAPNPPAITPITAGAIIVCIGAVALNNVALTLASSDLSNFVQARAASPNSAALGIGLKTDWVSGSFDAAAFTGGSGAADRSTAAMSVALRPA